MPSLSRIVRQFMPYIRKQRLLIGGGMLALVMEVLFRLLEPWPLKFIFDYVILSEGAGGASGIATIDTLAPMTLLILCVAAVVVFAGLRALMAYFSTMQDVLECCEQRLYGGIRGAAASKRRRGHADFKRQAPMQSGVTDVTIINRGVSDNARVEPGHARSSDRTAHGRDAAYRAIGFTAPKRYAPSSFGTRHES